MQIPRRGSFVTVTVLVALVIAACGQTAVPFGSLSFTVSGLPGGVAPLVEISGPNGYLEEFTAAQTVVGLAPGSYQVTGLQVYADSLTSVGFEYFEAPPVSAAVQSNQEATAAVHYPYSGLGVDDPEGDAVASGGTPAQYVYDVVAMNTFIEGTDLVIYIDFSGGQDDLSQSYGEFYFDVDQNDLTGEVPYLDDYCSEGSSIGAEFWMWFTPVGEEMWLETFPEFADVTLVERFDSGASSVFVVPLSALGSATGRVDIELVVGNADEPTDCLARGDVNWPTTVLNWTR